MAIKFTTTAKAKTHGVKILVYGAPKVGKTRACATAPKPLIISRESGLLSLRKQNIPAVEIETLQDLEDIHHKICTQSKYKQFKTICLDSLTEMAKSVLTDLKETTKDGRQIYGRLNEDIGRVIRLFRDLQGFNVYFTAKEKIVHDEETGITRCLPYMPGTTLTSELPYEFDCVAYLKKETSGGKIKRYLMTDGDHRYTVGDRSGALNSKEPVNLTKIFEKIERS